MSLLKKLLHKRIRLVIAALSICILSIALTLCWNLQLSSIINIVNSNGIITSGRIISAIVTILACMAISYILSMISGWTCETVAHDLRMGYAEHFTSLSLPEIENINSGEQLSMLQNEIDDISAFLYNNLFSFADDAVKFIATFIWMLCLNPRLTLLFNMPSVFITLYTGYTSRIISKAVHKSQQANAWMNGFADTLITVFPVLRLFDAANFIRVQYNKALDQWESAKVIEENTRAKLMSLSAVLSCLPLLLLVLIGGTQVVNGSTSIGTLYVFINLSGNVSGIMMNMPGRIAVFRKFSADMMRIEPYVSIKTGRTRK